MVGIEELVEELGFEPRDYQLKLVEEIVGNIRSGENVVLEAPTGTGKSVIAVLVAEWLLRNGYAEDGISISTTTKLLQEQYRKMLSGSKWKVVKGAGEYPCYLTGGNANSAPCRILDSERVGCPFESRCPYLKSKRDVQSMRVFTNHHLLFTKVKRCGIKRDLVILDEAHRVPSILLESLAVEVSDELLDFFSGVVGFPVEYTEDIEELSRVVNSAFPVIKETAERLLNQENLSAKKFELLLMAKLYFKDLAEALSDEWKIQLPLKDDSKVGYYVVRSARKLTTEFRDYINNYLLMSATVTPALANFLLGSGIYIVSPVSIPSNRRPVLVPCGIPKISYKSTEEDYRTLVSFIDTILEIHKSERGIVHVPSYSLAKKIISMSKYSRRFYLPLTISEAVEWINSEPLNSDRVLISPALFEGVDLRGDYSRFTIIAKVPFPSLGDPLVDYFRKRIPKWYEFETASRIVQGVGRSVRSKDDYAVAYILDANFAWFYNLNKDTFPYWFRDSVMFNVELYSHLLTSL